MGLKIFNERIQVNHWKTLNYIFFHSNKRTDLLTINFARSLCYIYYTLICLFNQFSSGRDNYLTQSHSFKVHRSKILLGGFSCVTR